MDTPRRTLAKGLEVLVKDETLIVIVRGSLREREFREVEAWASVRNVVVDFRRQDRYASTSLAFFVRLWGAVTSRRGRLVFCNVSRHEKELLRLTSLDQLWPVCSSLEDALAQVKG